MLHNAEGFMVWEKLQCALAFWYSRIVCTEDCDKNWKHRMLFMLNLFVAHILLALLYLYVLGG